MKLKIKNPLAFWYKLAKGLAVAGILFWLAETVYFMLLEGWHWRATNPLEVWCDGVVNSCFGGVFFAMMLCLDELIGQELKQRERRASKFAGSGVLKIDGEEIAKTMAVTWNNGKMADLKDEDLEPLNETK